MCEMCLADASPAKGRPLNTFVTTITSTIRHVASMTRSANQGMGLTHQHPLEKDVEHAWRVVEFVTGIFLENNHMSEKFVIKANFASTLALEDNLQNSAVGVGVGLPHTWDGLGRDVPGVGRSWSSEMTILGIGAWLKEGEKAVLNLCSRMGSLLSLCLCLRGHVKAGISSWICKTVSVSCVPDGPTRYQFSTNMLSRSKEPWWFHLILTQQFLWLVAWRGGPDDCNMGMLSAGTQSCLLGINKAYMHCWAEAVGWAIINVSHEAN